MDEQKLAEIFIECYEIGKSIAKDQNRRLEERHRSLLELDALEKRRIELEIVALEEKIKTVH